MKTWIAIAALVAVPAFGQSSTAVKKKLSPKAAAAKPAPRIAQPLVIPPDAVPTPEGTYAWTDKAGKKWLFSKTPFGISKVEDTGAAGASMTLNTAPPNQFTKAFEDGEKVRFERQTPFGTSKWEKKKSELSDDEKAILAAQQSAPKPE